MSEIIQFPVTEREWTEADVDHVQAEAFRDLEGEICDLDRMGEITEGLVMECSLNPNDDRRLELAAVQHLAKMLRDFKASYYKRWEPQE